MHSCGNWLHDLPLLIVGGGIYLYGSIWLVQYRANDWLKRKGFIK